MFTELSKLLPMNAAGVVEKLTNQTDRRRLESIVLYRVILAEKATFDRF